MSASSVPILVNERAGGGASLERIARAMEDAGVDADVRDVHPADLEAEILRALADSPHVIGVSGGDGTLLTAAGALAGTETALAPIPTGTLNHFARRLGIYDLAAAARAIAAGRTARMPLGIIDDRVFLNTGTFGLYADVVRRRERIRPLLSKWPAAAAAFASRLLALRHLDVTLEVGGDRLHRRTPLLWVGMGWGSFPFVHEAAERRRSPDLEIVVLRPRSRLGILALLARLSVSISRRERPVDDPALEVLHGRGLLIHAAHTVGATLDGEVRRLSPPIFIAVQDDALRVILPA